MHNIIVHHPLDSAKAMATTQPTSPFSCSAKCCIGWDIPLARLDHLSLFCFLPVPCALPASSLVGQYKKLKHPWLCAALFSKN